MCEDMPIRRRRHCLGLVESTLYALGGMVEGGSAAMTSVVAYDTRANKWSTAGHLTHAVRSAACVAYMNSVYVFGGIDKDGKSLDHVQKYDTNPQNCVVLPNAMPQAQHSMRAVLWNNFAILIGSQACYVYNLDEQLWQERHQYKTDVEYFGAAVVGEALFIAGGGRKKDKDSKVWECTDEVKSVHVGFVVEDKPAVWNLHARLPQPSLIQAHSVMSIYI